MTVRQTTSWLVRPAVAEEVEGLVAMGLRLQEHMARTNPELLGLSESGISAFSIKYRDALADTHAHLVVAKAQTITQRIR